MSKTKRRDKLLVNIVLDRDSDRFDTYESFTDLNEKTIMALGYIPARNYKEEMRYAWTKVYVKMEGFCCHDIRSDESPNLETSSTLNDYYQSDAQDLFMKDMTRISLPPLDLKKFGGIAIIGVGIVFGMLLLGGVM